MKSDNTSINPEHVRIILDYYHSDPDMLRGHQDAIEEVGNSVAICGEVEDFDLRYYYYGWAFHQVTLDRDYLPENMRDIDFTSAEQKEAEKLLIEETYKELKELTSDPAYIELARLQFKELIAIINKRRAANN